jgi:hypothetical protein
MYFGIIPLSGDAFCAAEQSTRQAGTKNTRKQGHDCEGRRGGEAKPVGCAERGPYCRFRLSYPQFQTG